MRSLEPMEDDTVIILSYYLIFVVEQEARLSYLISVKEQETSMGFKLLCSLKKLLSKELLSSKYAISMPNDP
jgi:hypothetical protein